MIERLYLPYSWINPKLKSGKSDIHGDGVFATAKILAGEKLMEFGGKLVPRERVFSGDYRGRSIWIVSQNLFLALPKDDLTESLDEHLNHSCDANAWLTDEVTLAAKRDILPGEEITLDQGTWNFEYTDYTDDEEPCFCGAKNCRRILTENDWKLPGVREKYAGHFHPIIQRMIDEEK